MIIKNIDGLLDLSKGSLNVAQILWNMKEVPGAYRSSCIALHRACEQVLLHLIKLSNTEGVNTHNIQLLVSKVNRDYSDSEWCMFFREYGNIITRWNIDAVEATDFIVDAKLFEDTCKACSACITDATKHVM